MEKHLEIKKALRVFNKITKYGQKVGNEYRLGDLIAESDFDGYTVTLRDQLVRLDIFFHNSHKFDYKNAAALNQFVQRIESMDKKEY